VNNLDWARIEADHAGFVDNELQFELLIEINSTDQNSPDRSQSTSENQEIKSSCGNDRETTNQPTPQSQRPEKEEQDTETDHSDETETSPALDAASSSRSGLNSQKSIDTGTQREVPTYQDPEQLSAVYKEDATFKEMREELDVEVTAQTVRKYMIKFGIHEPEPRPDRLLETIREAELDL
jgi:hypothetical protein